MRVFKLLITWPAFPRQHTTMEGTVPQNVKKPENKASCALIITKHTRLCKKLPYLVEYKCIIYKLKELLYSSKFNYGLSPKVSTFHCVQAQKCVLLFRLVSRSYWMWYEELSRPMSVLAALIQSLAHVTLWTLPIIHF